MIDLVQLQKDVQTLLLSAPILNTVNIVREQALISSQVEFDTIWQTVRNERSGNGILVEEITTKINSPAVGAQDLEITCVAFQNGDAAFTPETGAGFFAPNLAQTIIDLLNLQAIHGIGTISAIGVSAAREFDFIAATRATFRIIGANAIRTPRCQPIVYANNANVITLSCATAGAAIYYTLDGSTPCNPLLKLPVADENGNQAAVNPAAQLYELPFAIEAGQTLRAIAQLQAFNPSEILLKTIS